MAEKKKSSRRCGNCIGWDDCKSLGMDADEIGCSEWESRSHMFNKFNKYEIKNGKMV